jgi:anti-sigma factor RsiW
MNVKWNINRCQHQQEKISLLVSGLLNDRERAAAEEHMAGCANCQHYFIEVSAVARNLAQLHESAKALVPSDNLHNRWTRQILRRDAENVSWPRKVWQELILPARGIWIGFACVWAILLTLNFATADESTEMARNTPPNPEIIAEVKECWARVKSSAFPPPCFRLGLGAKEESNKWLVNPK